MLTRRQEDTSFLFRLGIHMPHLTNQVGRHFFPEKFSFKSFSSETITIPSLSWYIKSRWGTLLAYLGYMGKCRWIWFFGLAVLNRVYILNCLCPKQVRPRVGQSVLCQMKGVVHVFSNQHIFKCSVSLIKDEANEN